MLVVTNLRTSATLELNIPTESLLPQDSGSREAAEVAFDLVDPGMTFDLLPEDAITITKVEDSGLLFGGNVRELATTTNSVGRTYRIVAYDWSTLLDRVNVVQDDRAAGESDKARLTYLMTTYGGAVGLDDDDTGIATLNASMPAQKFRLLTLRQAIELVLGTALETATYRVNAGKKLDTWDTAGGLDAAPYDVVVGTPGAGEIAPESLAVKASTSNLFNAYFVRGASAAGSGWFTDAASIAAWGRREKYIDAPDSDLSWKAFNVGHAALADTAQPLYRGTFRTQDPASGWRSNQRFALTSAAHGLSAAPFDVARVTRAFLTGEGLQVYDVEFGSPKRSFAARQGRNARRSTGTGPGSSSGGFTDGGYIPGGPAGEREPDCDDCEPWVCDPTDFSVAVGEGGGSGSNLIISDPTWDGVQHGVTISALAPPLFTLYAGATYSVYLTVFHAVAPTESGWLNHIGVEAPGEGLTFDMGSLNGSPSPALVNALGEFTPSSTRSDFTTVFTAVNDVAHNSYTSTAEIGVTYISGPDPRFVDLPACTNPDPVPGQPIAPATTTGDGTTTDYTTQWPIRAGSIQVWVNGLDWTNRVIETDLETGNYSLDYPPPTGSTVRVGYHMEDPT